MKSITLFALFSLLLFFIFGCASTNARYIDPNGKDTIISLNKINIQDWEMASNQLVDSLLSSNVLNGSSEEPLVLGISRISNRTTQHVDTDMLIKKIRISLNETGKVETTTTIGSTAEDPLAKSNREYQAYINNETVDVLSTLPDYTLSGKLLEDTARAGSDRQVTYTFQMTLTSVDSGRAVWEDEVSITKAGKKSTVGW